MESHIRSCVVVRAPTPEEIKDNVELSLELSRTQIAIYRSNASEVVDVDCVFSGSPHQEEVYEQTVYPVIDLLFQGFSSAFVYLNAMNWMYGTYEDPGAFSRLVSDIYDEIAEKHISARVEFSAYQTHTQGASTRFHDLLAPSQGQEIRVKGIDRCSFRECPTADDLFDSFDEAATHAQESWHSAIAIRVSVYDAATPEYIRCGEIRLVDVKKGTAALSTELHSSQITKSIIMNPTPYLTTVIAALPPTSAFYHESYDVLVNGLRAVRQFAVDAQPSRELTQYGQDVAKLNALREQVARGNGRGAGGSYSGIHLADGAPATEEEERLQQLESVFQATYRHAAADQEEELLNDLPGDDAAAEAYLSARGSGYGFSSMERPFPRDAEGRLWKKRDVLARKHGSHAAVFIPTRSRKIGSDGGPQKTIYKGQWNENSKHGQGTEIAGDLKYEGQFKNGKRHGQGVLFKKHPKNAHAWIRIYKGGFVEGYYERHGTEYYESGEIYEGEFHKGLREGQGTFYYHNGDKYEGQWFEGVRNGFGTIVKSNGDYYEGHWFRDLKHGPGVYVYMSAGQRYDGEWIEDIPRSGSLRHIDGVQGTAAQLPEQHVIDADGILAEQIAKLRAEAAAAIRSA
eukprot:ANDGO_03307.mRNA.1 Phosphatidylinositol 4-phosphate 5-kinase 6